MKFFWKIFFTTMFISISCVALSGYVLINSNVKALLENEVNAAYDLGDVVYYSLFNELKDTKSYVLQNTSGNESFDVVGEIASSVNIYYTDGKIRFCMLKPESEIIFSSLEQKFDKDLISKLSVNQKGYVLKQTAEGTYIQAIRPAVFWETSCFIETVRDVTFVYDAQQLQYQQLLKIMLGMLLFAGVFTLIVSKLLMRQVVSLTKVTQTIAEGNLSQRVTVKSKDEFSVLSQNFNDMADDLEEKIHELQNEAEKRELFVGAFSHELKTPLTSIIGYSDMLRNKDMDQERIRLCANYIFSEGKRLETLSMRLLELIVLKNQEIKYTPISLERFFREINFVLSPQLMQSGIVLQCNIEPAVVEMEAELMKTVFFNLIDNARKSMDKGGKVKISGTRYGNLYTIIVEDNGKGMEEGELSKIKEAFYMVDKSRARKQGGAGLGLAICDEILKLHGFEILFESQVDVGTTVTITMKGATNE